MLYGDRVVLVTGARRGVGALVTEHFLANGAQVIGLSLHMDSRCDNTPGYTAIAGHVADPDSVAAAFSLIRKQFGRLDIVINNAAQMTSQYAMIMPAQAAKAMVDTNVLGSFLVAREGAKLMRRRRWGRLINISSMAAALEPAGDSVYAATKAASTTLTNVMAKEFAPLGITCNTLGITAYATDMLAALPEEKIAAVIAGLPQPRKAVAEDILNVVDFFASERSSAITAQILYLGGVN